MYTPSHFALVQPDELHRIMRTYALGTLVTHSADGLDANHLPFEFDATQGPLGTLTGHVASANPVWQQCAVGADVLVIFRGVEGYISPSWYPSKHEAHRQVPTWNYEVVHAHGRLTVRDDERFVRALVGRLTKRHEAAQPQPWKMADSAPEFIDELLGAIVGIEIEVSALVGKRKLGQNKAPRDRLGAAEALAAQGNAALAQAMRAAGLSSTSS